MSKTQEQRDHDEWIASERELTNQWLRLLSKTVVGDPEPEPSGPSVDELVWMDHETYGAQRQALGIPDGTEFPGTSSWSDRAQAHIAAQHAGTTQPETDMGKYAQERSALGVKDVGDVIGDPRGNLRSHESPWQL